MSTMPIRDAIEASGRPLTEDDVRAIGREAGAVLQAIVRRNSARSVVRVSLVEDAVNQ